MRKMIKSVFVLGASMMAMACTPVDEIVGKERVGLPTQKITTETCFEEWEYKTKYRDEPVYTYKKRKVVEPIYKWDRISNNKCTTSNGKRTCKTTYKKVKKKVGTKTVWKEERVRTGYKKVAYEERVADYGEQEVTWNEYNVRVTYSSGKVVNTTEREEVSKTECD